MQMRAGNTLTRLSLRLRPGELRQPTVVRDIPPQLVALMRTNINVQDLTVQALLTGNRDHIYHAAMLDPHTAAELDLDQIWALTDDLLAAHGDWLPEFARTEPKRKAG